MSGDHHDLQNALAERFLRYSAIESQSDAAATTVPTSPGQRALAELLRDELITSGAADVNLSGTSVLTAKIPSTMQPGQDVDPIGFCAHLDTVDVNLSPQVKARVHHYDGTPITLNEDLGIVLGEEEHPELAPYRGDRILVTDGTSVLGADDKAAIAAMMEAATRILDADAKAAGRLGRGDDELGQVDAAPVHGDIYLAFVPDEEIGLRGVRTLDLDRFPVQFAYTFDCCELGEIAEETFNAGSAVITVHGVTAHPMSAKGVLVNPILIANELISQLDPLQTPENTEGREGYIWVNGITGNQSTATIQLSIRDHDRALYAAKKVQLADIVERISAKYPRARVEVAIDDVYANLADAKTEANSVAADHAYKAMAELGITPKPLIMRGGTDGSWLSSQRIYTPNIFTGALNFHSQYEFLPLSSFERSYQMVHELIRQVASVRACH